MSSSRDYRTSNKTTPVGVSGWAPSPINYHAATHNPAQPLRVGSQDALQCPSLDYSGNRRPYWALDKQ